MLVGLSRAWMVAAIAVVALVTTLMQPVSSSAAEEAESALLSIPALSASPLPVEEPELPAGDGSVPEVSAAEPVAPLVEASPSVPAAETVDASNVAGLPVVERDMFSTTYERGDGGFVRHMSELPLNVELEPGEWAEVSTSIEAADEGWAVEAHPLRPQFAAGADGGETVTVEIAEQEVSYGLLGADA